MKLRTRLLLAIGLTMVCLFFGISQLSNEMVMRSFSDLEQKDATRNIERVRQTVEQMGDELYVKSADWAVWDDTYQFMTGTNPGYVKENVNENALLNLRIDLMLFIDEDLKHAASHAVKRSELPQPESKDIIKQLSPRLDTPSGVKEGVKGLVLHGDNPMLVTALPVRDSNGNGVRCGWIVFGAYIDAERVEKLRKITRLDAQAYPATAQAPHSVRKSGGDRKSSAGSHVVPVSKDVLAGYTYMKDLEGKPALLLRLRAPREIYQQGEATVRLINEMILLVALIFAAVLVLVLEKSALLRLSSLTRQVSHIEDHGGDGQIRLSGRDELGNLAARINGMLVRLRSERERDALQKREIAAKNSVLESAVEGIGQLDDHGRYMTANSAFVRLLDRDEEGIIGLHWSAGISPEDHPTMLAALRECHNEGRAEVLLRGLKRGGQIYYQEMTLILAEDEQGEKRTHIFAKDVTERKQLEMQIEHQAFHDKLTDLPNRALFMDRIDLALAKSKRHHLGSAVLFIDLDNFKLVNDSLGHDAGDALLIEVSNRLREAVRPGDTVARLGGDEFTILLEDLASIEEAEEIAGRVLESLRSPIKLGMTEAFASATIGIAFADEPDITPEALMKNADTTMYHAKSKGKACYATYDASMQDWATERMELETALRKSLEQGEIFAHYQPLISLDSGEIIGAEALARWNHPERGIVSPSVFIPIAEETGLIGAIGYFILEEACRQTKEWQEKFERPDLMISVNLSGRQIQQSDVVARVTEILRETGLAPTCLKLEITESVLMERAHCVDQLQRLRDMGIKLALDDFGTGFSSLSRLSAFPIDTIKIDRAFISRLDKEEHARAVVQAIMALSRSMNMDVTGEGVETDSQLKIIKSMGCDVGQGYLFSRPVVASAFADALAKVPTSRAA